MSTEETTKESTKDSTTEPNVGAGTHGSSHAGVGLQESGKGKGESEVARAVRKRFRGVVVSNKGEKTAVIRVERQKTHPRYKKKIRWSKRYLIHDEENELSVGNKVEFSESRPISRRKRFKLVRVLA